MNNLSSADKVILGLIGVLLLAAALAGIFLIAGNPFLLGGPNRETVITIASNDEEQGEVDLGMPEEEGMPAAEVVGSEVYDFSFYEESGQAYEEALDSLEEPWLPRKAVVKPKGPEGGDYPNAPAPVYTSYPGQVRKTRQGRYEPVGTRTWIGDMAVGTEVILKGAAEQGEWCFVTGETIGGWSSSGWVWCYRLDIPD